MDMSLKAALEAILYVSDDPVAIDQLVAAFPEAGKEAIAAALDQLAQEYDAPGRGITLRFVAGGWRLSTRLECHETVRQFLKSRPGFKLSMAALETLAIVAYKQPVTIPEIMSIRGVKSAGAVKTLLEKRLIAPRGRRKVVGSPMQYGTSKEFLLHFGLTSIRDLPAMDEIEELTGDGAAGRPSANTLFDSKAKGIQSFQAAPANPEDDPQDEPPADPLPPEPTPSHPMETI